MNWYGVQWLGQHNWPSKALTAQMLQSQLSVQDGPETQGEWITQCKLMPSIGWDKWGLSSEMNGCACGLGRRGSPKLRSSCRHSPGSCKRTRAHRGPACRPAHRPRGRGTPCPWRLLGSHGWMCHGSQQSSPRKLPCCKAEGKETHDCSYSQSICLTVQSAAVQSVKIKYALPTSLQSTFQEPNGAPLKIAC